VQSKGLLGILRLTLFAQNDGVVVLFAQNDGVVVLFAQNDGVAEIVTLSVVEGSQPHSFREVADEV